MGELEVARGRRLVKHWCCYNSDTKQSDGSSRGGLCAPVAGLGRSGSAVHSTLARLRRSRHSPLAARRSPPHEHSTGHDKMQCFLCLTYVVLVCSARPALRARRSLFHDVIESLRARAHQPAPAAPAPLRAALDHLDHLDHLDLDALPRRNDRLEMPMLTYRFPKNIKSNETNDDRGSPKEEIVLFIDAPDEGGDDTTTVKPKRTKRPRPPAKNKNKNKTDEGEQDNIDTTERKPASNTMSGQSQIGNRDSQTVVKPTVIVNFRGSVSHRESDIRLERRKYNGTRAGTPQNVFNINQEIKLESASGGRGGAGGRHVPGPVAPQVTQHVATSGGDLMMCETRRQRPRGALRIVLAL